MLNKWIDTLFLYLDLRCNTYSIAWLGPYLQQAKHVDVTVKQRGTVKWSSFVIPSMICSDGVQVLARDDPAAL